MLGVLLGLALMIMTAPGGDDSTRPRPTTVLAVTISPAPTGLPASTLVANAPVVTPLPRLSAEPAPRGQAAFVQSVVDGDTIRVMIDGVEFTVRYILVNTPERGETF